ncbi:AraC family transcriptional regulator [Bacillus chungangensis]|uniref:ABC-type Fe3+-hydroxamate transport system substrate-binding protein n=1 Tax=Bacillus chungangensis TaxID=587633 RepID=A0ABT9WTG2_9BACI|nr:helix-turn-helix domain-containing protein [Bacillus chungangensis]MDQ0176589.1 ABC-type Fe3+-hydroxamate transport system substrate-binding protein [Bacillus chungangensis]
MFNMEKATDGNNRMSLDDVRKYMGIHYDKQLSIDYLARMAGLSPNYFGEAFKKAFGQSTTDYMTELRIGHAKQLLRDSDLFLRDIARKVGYNDEFYFSRKFKKEVGVSPSAYSKNSRKRISVFSVSAIGHLLALGIVPVAAPLNPKWSPYYYYYYHYRIKVHLDISNSETEENFKKLLSAKPDVLFVQDIPSVNIIKRLKMSGIDIIPIEAKDWKAQLRELASALEKQTRCENWIHTYETKAAQARESIREYVGNDVFAVLRLSGNKIYLYSNLGIRDVIYNDLQLNLIHPERVPCNEQISFEQLSDLNPDRLLLLVCPDTETRNYWLSLQYLSQWKKLKAVKNEHLYLIPADPWFDYSCIGMNRILDEMLLMLTGKNPNPFPAPVHGVLPDIDL